MNSSPGDNSEGPPSLLVRPSFLERLAKLFSVRGAPSGKAAVAAAEQKASRAEARLRDAIDALPEGLVFLDAEGRYVLWNKRYAEIYKRSADLFQPGARLADTLRIGVARGDYPEAVGREEEWLANRLTMMANPGERHEQRLADGRWILIEERRTADGGTIGIRVDITELKNAEAEALSARERAEAASHAKSDFLANMSHEIRTPLNGVLGLVTALERTHVDGYQAELISTIKGSAVALNTLLTGILDISRIESGRIEIADQPFAIRELAAESVGLFTAVAREKGLGLTLDLSPEADDRVRGDAPRLRQVLTNLINNAVKFTGTGEVRVSVSARPDGDRKRYVLEVSDTGIGFDDETAERLFQRFEQADGSITRRYGGTGLGLAICRGLIEKMGGTIRAQGRPGLGATFTVETPLTVLSETADEPSGEAEPGGAGAIGGRRLDILLAEDNATNRKVVELMLGAIGMIDLASVDNGLDAVKSITARRFDLVLMDLQMPVLDGLGAIRAIRKHEAANGKPPTPVVVLSANIMPEHLAASAEAGADGHIGKPIDASELLATVAAFCGDEKPG